MKPVSAVVRFFARQPETHTRTVCRSRKEPWLSVTPVRVHVFRTRVESPQTEHRWRGSSASTSTPATLCERCRHCCRNCSIACLKLAISVSVTGRPFFLHRRRERLPQPVRASRYGRPREAGRRWQLDPPAGGG